MSHLYDTGLTFSRIEIIESIRQGDLRSGLNLYEALLLPAHLNANGPPARHHAVATAAELQATLSSLETTARATASAPLIHLEAHGSEDGLELTSGELIPWSAIARQLTPINEAAKMNLLVVSSACKGWYLTTGLVPADRAPLFMLIGPPETIGAGSLSDAQTRFYHELATSWQIDKALSAMNHGADYDHWVIKPATAEILFCRLFRNYLVDLADGTELREQENRMVADAVRSRGLDLVQSAVARQEIRAVLHDHRTTYEYLRRTFLMLDLYPENASRFGLTYDLCVESAA